MRRAAITAGAALLLAGCASSASGAGGATHSAGPLRGEITVDAGSSLKEAFTTIESRFERAHRGAKITIIYGASSDFATQIREGAPVDVFASASQKNMAELGSLAVHPVDFAANTAEIAVPPDNPAHITALTDLAKPGVKLAICAAAVPCGVVAKEVLGKAEIAVHPVASLADVKSTLAAVESGEVDAGIVYVTDVRAAGGRVRGIPIPGRVNAKTVYPIATLKNARNPALANAFVDYLLSAAGRRVLARDGFRAP